ncbi:MAG: hypothetical protein WBC22_13435 [Sedimentisphaerales bacterium]
MKKKICLALIAVVVLSTAWTVFAQREGGTTGRRSGGAGMFMLTPEQREKMRDMSQEEREKLMAEMREKWQNMSEEEQEKARAAMRERFGGRGQRMGREDQLKAIEDVEKQLASLKKGIQAQPTERRSFRDLSEEERTKLREESTKAREERNKAFKAIITQIARLQGQRQPAEGEELLIINTGQLKPIQELAVKEKAKETAQRLERLMSGGRRGSFGGRTGDRPPATGTTERPRRRSTE